jgi:hypothetical protein
MIEFITYKKEKHPIRISYYVLLMAQKESGLALEDIDKNFEAQQTILWYALIAGHKMADKEMTLKREDMIWVLDESYLEFQKALIGFARSIVDMQEEITKGDSKKK